MYSTETTTTSIPSDSSPPPRPPRRLATSTSLTDGDDASSAGSRSNRSSTRSRNSYNGVVTTTTSSSNSKTVAALTPPPSFPRIPPVPPAPTPVDSPRIGARPSRLAKTLTPLAVNGGSGGGKQPQPLSPTSAAKAAAVQAAVAKSAALMAALSVDPSGSPRRPRKRGAQTANSPFLSTSHSCSSSPAAPGTPVAAHQGFTFGHATPPLSSSSAAESTAARRRRKMTQLTKQLSLNGLRRRILLSARSSTESVESGVEHDDEDHLLEEVEPVSVTPLTSLTDGSDPTSTDGVAPAHPPLQMPCSLVTLTEQEKRRLEDVLMRIGLKDCGL